jgi:hypothetical protein
VSRLRSPLIPDLVLLVLLAATALVVVADVQPVRPFVVLAAACFVPGGAILTRLRTGEAMTDVALAVGLSLAMEIAGSLVLAWSGWWHPEALGIVLGAGSMGLLVADLVEVRRRVVPSLVTKAPRRASSLLRTVAERRSAVRAAATLVPLVGALVAWALSLHMIHTGDLGVYGLPPALPAIWYAALAVLICGAVTATWATRPRAPLIALYIFAIVVVLFATVPAITAVPHYAWVYKHIGVTRFIAAHGGVQFASGDIYDRWPGFFGVAAAFSQLAGIDPLSYAAWAEPFFALIDALLVAAIARGITRDVRVAGYAALIFTQGSWVGQAYFSPQAAAYALAFVLMLVFVRSFASGDVMPWLARLMQRVIRRDQPRVALADPLPWSRAASIATVLVLDAVIVATHQLTPYVLLLQLGALTVLGTARPRWLIVAMGIITLAYLLPNLGYIAHNYGLFTSLNPTNNIRGGNWGPPHVDWFDANAGGVLSVVLIMLMSASAFRLARLGLGYRALPLLILALAPFGILLAQNYGGEASLRVFLFSSPWRDVLVALGVQTIARPRVRLAAALVTCLVLAYMFIPAFYGAEELNIIPKSEVQASEYFYDHAPAGSVLMLSSPDFPTWVGARYSLMRGPLADDRPSLVGVSAFEGRPLGPRQIPAVIAAIRQYSRKGFLVFSTTQDRYTALQELTPRGALESLERAVAASSHFRLWYATSDARIYELIG